MVNDAADRSMDEMASLTMKQPSDSTGTAIQPQGCVLALPSPSALAGDKEEEAPVVGGGDQAADDEEDEVSYYSDDSYDEEESDDEVEVPIKIDSRVAAVASSARGGPPLLRGRYVPEGRVLGPTLRFASSVNRAGFLGVAFVVPPPTGRPTTSQEQGGGKDKEILVLYR